MRRRHFILGGAAAAWPLTAFAQQGERQRRIGVLIGLGESDPEGKRWADALVTSLQKLGWKQGENLQIEIRWGGVDDARIEIAAKELLALNPELMAVSTTGHGCSSRHKNENSGGVRCRIRSNRPRFCHQFGSTLGFMNVEGSIGGKWVELLKEVAPRLSHLAVLYNSTRAKPLLNYYRDPIEAAGRSFGVTTQLTPWDDIKTLEQAITALGQKLDTGLIVIPTPHTIAERELIVSLAKRYSMPAIYAFPFWVRDGGLISYQVDLPDLHRRAAGYVDRILKGEKPGDLPVQLPTKFEMTVNLKTAAAMGLAVPPILITRADDVIE